VINSLMNAFEAYRELGFQIGRVFFARPMHGPPPIGSASVKKSMEEAKALQGKRSGGGREREESWGWTFEGRDLKILRKLKRSAPS